MKLAITLAAVAALSAGCATQRSYQQPYQQPYQQSGYQPVPARAQYGEVERIDATRAAASGGGGAIVGGIVGALLGNAVGHGGEKAIATGVGAVGGALLGDQIEKQQRGRAEGSWRVVVRLDNGSQRAFEYAQLSDLRVGDRVRVEGNQLVRN